MRWTPCGPQAVLIQLEEPLGSALLARMRAISHLLETEQPEEIVDFTVAFDKLLLEFRAGEDIPAQAELWTHWFAALAPIIADAARLHEIPVVYDGLDLAEVAERGGMSLAEVIELHTAPIYEVASLGFAPGFPYLIGLNPRLYTPRRADPRPRVPVGSVAIGGSHTGIYSIESPGGWNLLGTTEVQMFDPARCEPEESAMFLLRPGDRVKFLPLG